MATTFTNPLEGLRRYLGADAPYPWLTTLRTPLGTIDVLIPHSHDVRTVNEIFYRKDYGNTAPKVAVDVGANIGIAALYFLTRRPDSVVHCWEPVPHNLTTLRVNLAPFADRCHIHEKALAPQAGPSTFAVEPVGRYSGIADYIEASDRYEKITVECDAIGDALRRVINEEGRIDLLQDRYRGQRAGFGRSPASRRTPKRPGARLRVARRDRPHQPGDVPVTTCWCR